jgi:tetratricopeptide (TPR) repeat protein
MRPGVTSTSRPLLAATALLVFVAPGLRAQVSPDIANDANRAVQAFEEGRYDEALRAFQQAVRKAKNHRPTVEEHLLEAQLQLRQGDASAALGSVARALELDPRSADAHYVRGHVLRLRGDVQEAFEALDHALELKPDHAGAAEELWELLEPRREYGLAIRTFRKHLERAPQSLHLTYHLGLAYEESHDYERATDAFIQAVRIDPRQAVVHNHLIQALDKKEGRREAVIAAYTQLAAEKPDPMLRLFLAQLHIRNGAEEPALALLEELAGADSPMVDASLRLALAQTFAQIGRYGDAVEQVDRVLSQLPPDAPERIQLLFDRGKWLVAAGRVEEGVRSLENSLELHMRTLPDPPTAHYFQLGNAYRLLGNREQAELYFRQFERRLEEIGFYTDPETLTHLGDIYMEDGNFRRAAECYRRVVEHDPQLGDVRLKLARAYLAEGAFPQAIVEAERLVGDGALGTAASLLLARAYLQDGQPSKAVGVLERLETAAGGTGDGDGGWSDEASAVMGEALLAGEASRPQLALDYIEPAYRADPANPDRTLLYAQVLALVGRYNDARKLYRKVLAAEPRSARALGGLGALEVRVAEQSRGGRRAAALERAVEHLKKARDSAPTDLGILVKLGDAQRALARIEASRLGRQSRLQTVIWTSAVLFVAAVVIGLMGRYVSSLLAERLVGRVGELEVELRQLVRRAGRARWGEEWQEALTRGRYGDRLGGSYLRKKAEKTNQPDLLSASDFGHLVAILDVGLHDEGDPLGFRQRCRPDTSQTTALIVATLSYIASCRAALVHFHEIDRASGSDAEPRKRNRQRKSALKHMDLQLRRSLSLVRDHFDMTPSPAAG